MSYLAIATTVLGVLVSIYRQFFSDSALLKRLELKYAALQARQEVEAERLKATYARIDREPDLTGKALADKLNETMRKLKHQP